ncbi:MAG: surfeit 1 protein [Proteobacteria bacterium]|nr:MAG: surfeit 1 protein [Pseudomonadota bacterium]
MIIPSLFALTLLGAFLALGTWQVQRKAWKEQLIKTLEQRLLSPPTALPGRDRWPALTPIEHEFERVKFIAAYAPGDEALVYAAATSLRPDVVGPGYWVLARAKLPSGEQIVVNRGFVPEGRQQPSTRGDGEIAGPHESVGVMRWPEERGLFVPMDDPERNLWFARDPVAIAVAKGWGEVPPFYIDLEEPQPPGGLPRPGRLQPNLRNAHLEYALTWYGLALVVLVMFTAWVVRNGSRRSAPRT